MPESNLRKIVIALLALQFVASLGLTAFYAVEQIILANHHIEYSKGWLYYYKWVIKPTSAIVACFLCLTMVFRGLIAKIRSRLTHFISMPLMLTLMSLVFSGLWGVIFGFLITTHRQFDGDSVEGDDLQGGAITIPLGDGFSLQNNCHQKPFTLKDIGVKACMLLKAESITNLVCFGIWFVTFVCGIGLYVLHRRELRFPIYPQWY